MDSQQLITLAIAAVAGLYLLRRSIVSLRADKPGCGTCSGCPSPGDETKLPVRRQLHSLGAKSQGRE